MRNDYYPPGSVRALLNTSAVSSQTNDVLNKRLDKEGIKSPSFFNKEEFLIIQIVCDRLIPQSLSNKVDLAGCLDEMLLSGKGNGWRYDRMPPDKEAHLKGLAGIEETSLLQFGSGFQNLDEGKQCDVLYAIQQNSARGKIWKEMPANLFFEELLAALVEIYYSHPDAREEIGEVSMADTTGWQKIGLDEREAREPEAINYKVIVNNTNK